MYDCFVDVDVVLVVADDLLVVDDDRIVVVVVLIVALIVVDLFLVAHSFVFVFVFVSAFVAVCFLSAFVGDQRLHAATRPNESAVQQCGVARRQTPRGCFERARATRRLVRRRIRAPARAKAPPRLPFLFTVCSILTVDH